MTVTASDWKYPNVTVNFGEEDSSVIEQIQFHRQQEHGKMEMTALFRAGSVYLYHEVDEMDIAAVLFANSIGSAFNKVISQSNKYEFTRIV
tara:strand:+ start:870 stop:1142 length:273 start_codon:yes stop_codon:yes gene_type:complete